MAYIYTMFPENRIRELRKAKNWSQGDLGDAIGLHQTQVGKLENSERALSFEWARRIAAALGVKLADLLTEADNPDRLQEDERKLIHNFRAADDKQKKLVQRTAQPIDGDEIDDRSVA